MPKRMLVSFNRRGGKSGCSPRCCLPSALARIQISSGSTAASISCSVHGQCSSGPSAIGNSRQQRISARLKVPCQSMRECASRRVSGTYRGLKASTSRQIGTLIKKALRQPKPAISADTSQPPPIWPTIKAIPPMPPYRLMARAWAVPFRVTCKVARICGTISAAPAPCTTRAASSVLMEFAIPHSREATPNIATPHINRRRRP